MLFEFFSKDLLLKKVKKIIFWPKFQIYVLYSSYRKNIIKTILWYNMYQNGVWRPSKIMFLIKFDEIVHFRSPFDHFDKFSFCFFIKNFQFGCVVKHIKTGQNIFKNFLNLVQISIVPDMSGGITPDTSLFPWEKFFRRFYETGNPFGFSKSDWSDIP